MSNIAGKAYAMNVITPQSMLTYYISKIIFKVAQLSVFQSKLGGLATLSLIHYARWAVIGRKQFPHLSKEQPRENLNYNYMLFFSNFNGSWEQYVDSFHKAIPSGLDLLWRNNVKYPKSVPLQPFHAYINFNQMWTSHYYSAYPIAASNDVKSAKKVRKELTGLAEKMDDLSDNEFKEAYEDMLLDLQHHISTMEDTPVISLASQAVKNRRNKYKAKTVLKAKNISPLKQTTAND